ncbi:MAG: AIPR family protein [Bacteroidota bacterium]|nr:AIPR family protein [Bacteroidota bacterium]
MQAFIDETVNFLIGNSLIEPFSSIYSTLLNEEGDYIDNLTDTPRVSLYYLSARTNHNIEDDILNIEKQKITQRKEIENRFALNDIYFWQKDIIKDKYGNISKLHSVQIQFHKNVQLEEKDEVKISLLASIKFSELKKLILTKDENIREKLFIDNVRTFIGETPVNLDIKKTLNDPKYNQYFIFLNNGLTIICDNLERHQVKQDVYNLKYPRIINGCQTTNILFDYNKQNPNQIDDLDIVVKVIATQNNDLKKNIIFAANNQNSIDRDLQSLNEYHEQIEQYFQGRDTIKLFYERLRGQYSRISPPYKKINPLNIARIYISVFLREPHKMKSNALSKIDEYVEKKKVFNPQSSKIEDYYYCAILNYWFYYFLSNKVITLKSKTMDMHLLMSCNLQLEFEGYVETNNKIEHISDENNARTIFNKVNEKIQTQEYLFQRRGFYSSPKTKMLIKYLKEVYDNIMKLN